MARAVSTNDDGHCLGTLEGVRVPPLKCIFGGSTTRWFQRSFPPKRKMERHDGEISIKSLKAWNISVILKPQEFLINQHYHRKKRWHVLLTFSEES